jgi:hypothetical protein
MKAAVAAVVATGEVRGRAAGAGSASSRCEGFAAIV